MNTLSIEKQDEVFRLIFSFNMEELLRIKNLTDLLYKEDSVYLGGSQRYIPKVDWNNVLWNMENEEDRYLDDFKPQMDICEKCDKEFLREDRLEMCMDCWNNLTKRK